MTYDIIALAGALLISAGIWEQFGWAYSIMFFGLLLLIAGIMGAKNVPRKDTE